MKYLVAIFPGRHASSFGGRNRFVAFLVLAALLFEVLRVEDRIGRLGLGRRYSGNS